ncbi:MAG: hypothetical protein EA401_05220 [Planctomycetota bacterium]|nr:MAG: hypothetical protein EA401_05220 [Planctomycetota bacterium]
MFYRPAAVVASLAALVAIGSSYTAPSAVASEIKTENLSVRFGVRLQSRIDIPAAVDNAAGDSVGLDGGAEEYDFDMYMRRIRLAIRGTYMEDTNYNLTLSADNLGRNGDGDFTETVRSNDRMDPTVRYAWVSHRIKSGDLTHTIKFGLDKPWFVSSDTDSSSRTLFPNGRPLGGQFAGDRTVGLSYRLSAPMVNFGADIMPARNDSRNLQITARAETSLQEEWKMRRTESMLGKEGFGHVLGVEVGTRTESETDDDGWFQFGIDYNVHWNNITANIDLIVRNQETAGDSQTQFGFTAQAGYAIPLDTGHVVEPALRIGFFDYDEEGDIGLATREDVDSGIQVDAGVNYYINGHNNKFQFAISHWSADEGDAQKTVLRLQHQLNF